MSVEQELDEMMFEDASRELSNAVYEATAKLEALEHAGRFRGNSHHVRQSIAAFAVSELKERWKRPRKS